LKFGAHVKNGNFTKSKLQEINFSDIWTEIITLKILINKG
jgi:hypothetical protein